MSEVTAEMIERGRGGDPKLAAERRRIALKVREAREKLTSSGSGHRSFDLELLTLFAKGRRASLPAMIGLALILGAAACRWTNPTHAVAWFTLDLLALAIAFAVSARFLARPASSIIVRHWRRTFVLSEAIQGLVWSLMMALMMDAPPAAAQTFALVALILTAAMNATVTSLVPATIYAASLPPALAVLALLRPTSVLDNAAVLATLACGTLIYFLVLGRRLYATALEGLSFQAEKDALIGELEQAKSNSDLARHRAEEANLAKSRFLATMSHELRTPLNAILGFSEVMKGELFGAHAVPSYKEYSNDIHSSGQHLLMLINEILDLSRVEAGRYELREESVALAHVVEDCRHLLTLRAKQRGLAIANAIESGLPRLWADERAVRQVVLNLLSNAIKFTPQGGSITIKVGWTAAGGQYLSIRDTGPGIPEAEIPTIMDSFGRGSLAQKNAEEGTGLGLPIVKGLVELHGGTFTLKSKVREGTEVVVIFPPERVMDALPQLDPTTVGRTPEHRRSLRRNAA